MITLTKVTNPEMLCVTNLMRVSMDINEDDASIDDLLESFEDFLTCIGYSFQGKRLAVIIEEGHR